MLPRSGKIKKNTPLQLSQLVSCFRENSQKFVIQIFTKNLAFNLSGTFFFVGLGCSLKWWYKDQLLILLLKQNLPALSQPEQKISWETGEYILGEQNYQVTEKKERIFLNSENLTTTYPYGVTALALTSGKSPILKKNLVSACNAFSSFTGPNSIEVLGNPSRDPIKNLADQEMNIVNTTFHHLIERIDFYTNHAVVKFKPPWQKHVYQRFIGVFSEPAQITKLKNLVLPLRGPYVEEKDAYFSFNDSSISTSKSLGSSFGLNFDKTCQKFFSGTPLMSDNITQEKDTREKLSTKSTTSSAPFVENSLKNKYSNKYQTNLSKGLFTGVKRQIFDLVNTEGERKRVFVGETDNKNLVAEQKNYKFWKPITPVNWFQLSARGLCTLNEEILLDDLEPVACPPEGERKATSDLKSMRKALSFKKQIFKSPSSLDKKFIELRANIKTHHFSLLNAKKSKLNNTLFFENAFSRGEKDREVNKENYKRENKSLHPITLFSSAHPLKYDQTVKDYQRITNLSQICCPLAVKLKNSNSKLTIIKNLSYPLEFTKTLTGWQPPIDSLVLNSYLDEIPYKLESILILFPWKNNSQILTPTGSNLKTQVSNNLPLKSQVPLLTLSSQTPIRSKKVTSVSVSFFDSYQSRQTIYPCEVKVSKIPNSNASVMQNSFFYPTPNPAGVLGYGVQIPRAISTCLQNHKCTDKENFVAYPPEGERKEQPSEISLNNQTKPFLTIKTPNETFLKKLQLVEIKQLLKNELQLLVNKLPLHFVDQSFIDYVETKEHNVVRPPTIQQSKESKKEIVSLSTTFDFVDTLRGKKEKSFQPNTYGLTSVDTFSDINVGLGQFRRQLPLAKSTYTVDRIEQAPHDYHEVPLTNLGLVITGNINVIGDPSGYESLLPSVENINRGLPSSSEAAPSGSDVRRKNVPQGVKTSITNSPSQNSHKVVDYVEQKGKSDGFIGSELDLKRLSLTHKSVNSVDSLYLLNNLGFTFNNLSTLNIPPLLLPIKNSASFWMWNQPIRAKQFFGISNMCRKIASLISVTTWGEKNDFFKQRLSTTFDFVDTLRGKKENFLRQSRLTASSVLPQRVVHQSEKTDFRFGYPEGVRHRRSKKGTDKFINQVDKETIFRFSPTSLTWKIYHQPSCNEHISSIATKGGENRLKNKLKSSQLFVINKIILKEKKTVLEYINGTNPLDKKVDLANQKSRFMSGYVYPDIQSNLLKTNLYRGIPLLKTKSQPIFSNLTGPIGPLQEFKISIPLGHTYTNIIGDHQNSCRRESKSPYLCNITTTFVDSFRQKSYPKGVEETKGVKEAAKQVDSKANHQIELYNKISWALYPRSFQQVYKFLDQACLASVEIPITGTKTFFSRYSTLKGNGVKEATHEVDSNLLANQQFVSSYPEGVGGGIHYGNTLTDHVIKKNELNSSKKAAFPFLENQINKINVPSSLIDTLMKKTVGKTNSLQNQSLETKLLNFLPSITPLGYGQGYEQINQVMPNLKYGCLSLPLGVHSFDVRPQNASPVKRTSGVLKLCLNRMNSIFRYQELNHHLAYFPGFTRPNQFFFSLTQIAHGDDTITIENISLPFKNSVQKTVDPQIISYPTSTGEGGRQILNSVDTEGVRTSDRDIFLSKSTNANGYYPEGVKDKVTKVVDRVEKETKNSGLLGKSGKYFVDCDSRKTAYRGIVLERNNLTKDFQPLKESMKEYLLWGTAFLGSENPFTDRQSHFFGQRQLSTIDTNGSQRDYLRQLGKETLAQSNSKGWCEAPVTSGAERAKILSFSKTMNSFSLKKRKYTYLLEKKDQWHLLFQEQLRTALEDPKKYTPLTIDEKKDRGPDRIKISAPLIMARFPKRLFSQKLPFCLHPYAGEFHYSDQVAFDYVDNHLNQENLMASRHTLPLRGKKEAAKGDNHIDCSQKNRLKEQRLNSFLMLPLRVHPRFVQNSEWPKFQHNFPWRPLRYLEPYQLLPPISLTFKDEKIVFASHNLSEKTKSKQNIEDSFYLPKIVSHYPLFAEKQNIELNYVPRLNKSWVSINNNPVINVQWLTHETLTVNSWAVVCQWSFLVALLVWIEQMLVKNVFPALFALEQLLLGANGLRSNDRANVIRVSKSETPKFQDIAGVDGLLGELAEFVLFLRGQKKSSYGVLLTGPPGTGKTFLVRALANEARVPVLILSAGALNANRWNNNKPSWSIRHAFRRAKQLAPCILFIDEIDALGRSRGKIVTDINEIVTDTNLGLPGSYKRQNDSTSSINTLHSERIQNESSIAGINVQTNSFKRDFGVANYVDTINNEIDRSSLCEDDRSDFSENFVQQSSIRTSSNRLSNQMRTGQQFDGGIKNTGTFASQEATKRKFGPLTQLLVSMDGVNNLSGVLIIGATNRPESLDTALTRPGRFERIIRIEKPAEQKRIEILKLYSHNLGVQHKIPWSYLANRTVGLTAADLAVAMNYSSLKAIAQGSLHTIETIEYGLDSIARFPNTTSITIKSNYLPDSVILVPRTSKRHRK